MTQICSVAHACKTDAFQPSILIVLSLTATNSGAKSANRFSPYGPKVKFNISDQSQIPSFTVLPYLLSYLWLGGSLSFLATMQLNAGHSLPRPILSLLGSPAPGQNKEYCYMTLSERKPRQHYTPLQYLSNGAPRVYSMPSMIMSIWHGTRETGTNALFPI